MVAGMNPIGAYRSGGGAIKEGTFRGPTEFEGLLSPFSLMAMTTKWYSLPFVIVVIVQAVKAPASTVPEYWSRVAPNLILYPVAPSTGDQLNRTD